MAQDILLLKRVQDQELKEILKKAEQSLNKQKYDEAVEQAILAIYKNVWKLKKKFPPPYVSNSIMETSRGNGMTSY